jgi:hypothetical protein
MGIIRIYTDESVNVAVVEGLKRRGVDSFSAMDAGELGLTDEDQLIFANKEMATIFIHDTDFLRIASKWIEEGRTHHGIIYCHQKDYTIGEFYIDIGKKEKAFEYLKKAESMSKEMDMDYWLFKQLLTSGNTGRIL